MPVPGDPAPRFTLPTTAGELSLDDLTARGKVVLAFYAEDATPLCSSQLSMLKDDYDTVRELGASVLAVSADSLDSHRQFAERLDGLPFPLASDEDLTVARIAQCWERVGSGGGRDEGKIRGTRRQDLRRGLLCVLVAMTVSAKADDRSG